MSTVSRNSRRSHSRNQHSGGDIPQPPYGQALTPSHDNHIEGCSATNDFFLYAQRNIILCLEHNSLAIARRFDKHREDVQWISADNVSERGGGRYVVSYDNGLTTIVWDVYTGDEVARFASYEDIRTAAWMKNGNIAFGNSQGNVILFEPSTSEHISSRTIFDPITALAPAADCRTFALGYMNGSILVATLQPSFTILHTLSTNRAPSPLNKLAWHGSSSKQKSDMLAAQTADGDLRVWSIPKVQGTDQPSIIRVLSRQENDRINGLCWFGWSKMGRIVQYSDGLTFVWDVRTKRVTYESVPTVDGLVGITNYGPSAKLFTLGRNHTVQQYDLNPNSRPMLVKNVQHVPANLPPSPPISDGLHDSSGRYVTAPAPPPQRRSEHNSNLPLYLDVESSDAEEGMMKSPLQRIAGQDESDISEEEIMEERDRLGPLSPVSSRASSTASRSSRGGGRRKREQQSSSRPGSKEEMRHDQRPKTPGSVAYSAHSGSTHTTFSMGQSTTFSMGSSNRSGYQNRAMRESVSTRSLLSNSTSAKSGQSSRLRQEVLRSPQETKNTQLMDLFPYTKARLNEIPFRPPQYDKNRATPDDLRNQMLEVVFGWGDDIEELVRDELARHPPGSASGVMLAKWLGDLEADIAASMIGSESMTSSDWMLLALSSMGQDSQKKVGEAFVQRLLEKGDIHPAVSILLGLGEFNDAVEVYVSRKYYMEAVLLTCLLFSTDWQRISFLVRKWGEVAVSQGQAELAVRCFSCTSMESSEPWFSPRAQDEIYALQQRILAPDTPPGVGPSPISPRSAGGGRLLPNQVGLKLVTNFKPSGAARDPRTAIDEKTPMVHGMTPIDAAFTPAGRRDRKMEPMSAMSTRTATPGGFGRRRVPSSSRAGSSRTQDTATPHGSNWDYPNTAIAPSRSETSSVASSRARSVSHSQTTGSYLTASTYQADDAARQGLPSPAHDAFSRLRQTSVSRTSDRNKDNLVLRIDDVIIDPSIPSSVPTGASASAFMQPPLTGASSIRSQQAMPNMSSDMSNAKMQSIDAYIHGLDESGWDQHRAENKSRATDRPGSRTAQRAPSESRGRTNTKYIRAAKRSPSSPVSMSPDDPALQIKNYIGDDAEKFYQLRSPAESRPEPRPESRQSTGPQRRERSRDPGGRAGSRAASQTRRTRSRSRAPMNRQQSEEVIDDGRGRSSIRNETAGQRSPSSPRPMSPAGSTMSKTKVGERVRERSMSRRPSEAHRAQSPDQAPGSRRPSKPAMPRLNTDLPESKLIRRTRKQTAAEDLEARRLSLMRRPSAPPVIHPNELRSAIEPSVDLDKLFMNATDLEMMRGHTADPHALRKIMSQQPAGTSTKSVPIGLPATPRAMRHPKDMAGNGENVPAVPEIPPSFNGLPNAAAPAPATLAAPEPAGDLLTLLPTSTYKPPTGPHSRSASAPPEKFQGHQRRPSAAHSRQNSRDNVVKPPIPVLSPGLDGRLKLSIDESVRESQVIIIDQPDHEEEEAPPPLLPQLQHLAGLGDPAPPPPPPPPAAPLAPPQHSPNPSASEATINIMVDEQPSSRHVSPPAGTPPSDGPTPVPPESSATPSQGHRRGRGSISESIGSRLRGFGGRTRERSASRQRPVISPPVQYTPAPYESVGQQRRPSQSNIQPVARQPMPYESIGRVASPPADQGGLLPSTTFGGYRNPKEIARQMREREEAAAGIERSMTAPPRSTSRVRANMPPGWQQHGTENQI